MWPSCTTGGWRPNVNKGDLTRLEIRQLLVEASGLEPETFMGMTLEEVISDVGALIDKWKTLSSAQEVIMGMNEKRIMALELEVASLQGVLNDFTRGNS